MVMRAGVLRAALHRFGVTVPAAGGITTAWDPATAVARVSLSGGPPATTVTATGNVGTVGFANVVRSTTSKSSGKWYLAIDCTAFVTANDTAFGWVDGSFPVGLDQAFHLGDTASSAGYTQSNAFVTNGSAVASNSTGANFWSLLCIDVPNKKSYLGLPGFGWYSPGSSGTSLAANAGAGFPTIGSPIYIACQANETGDSWTFNTGAAAFDASLSTLITEAQGQGYSQWG